MTFKYEQKEEMWNLLEQCPKALYNEFWFVRGLSIRHPSGFFFLAVRCKDTGRFTERGFKVRSQQGDMLKFLHDHRPTKYDHYFCPNVFSQRTRMAKYALDTPYAWCDIDDGDVGKFAPKPNFVIQTSPGRTQGIWTFETFAGARKAEAVSKHLAYTYGGDRNGWSVTKYLRCPFTRNHKPERKYARVKLIHKDYKPIADWPDVEPIAQTPEETFGLDPIKYNWCEVLAKYASKLSHMSISLMKADRTLPGDRSALVYKIVSELDNAGASPDEIASVLWRNPYFTSKYGQSRRALDVQVLRILGKLKVAK